MAVHVTRTGVALTVGVIILALAALGTLYMLKEQGEQARREEAIQIAEEQLRAEANGEVALNGGSENDAENSAENTPANGSGAENGAVAVPETGVNPETELPQTGPADTALMALLVGAVTFVVVSSCSGSLKSDRAVFSKAK